MMAVDAGTEPILGCGSSKLRMVVDMADPRKIVSSNVSGNFFVDTTCINCDTCRQLAPGSFADTGEYSAVLRRGNWLIGSHKYLPFLAERFETMGGIKH
jgi:hypothetical protein